MTTLTQTAKPSSSFPLKGDLFTKSRGVTFGINSTESIPDETIKTKQKIIETDTSLPVNFFHSPGQYNKMLIQCGYKEKTSNIDRQMGILRSLEFLNDPLFETEKQKREERVRAYEKMMREKCSIKTNSHIQKCACCCCDDFCESCAAKTLCEKEDSMRDHQNQSQKQKWLIDIQAMKRGEYKKKKISIKNVNNLSEEDQSCHSKNTVSKYRIDELINNTLIKSIQQKRNKQLERLIKRQHKNAVQNFNESVRYQNRRHSASRSQGKKPVQPSKFELKNQSHSYLRPQIKKQVQPSKFELREAYWQSIKDLVAYQLKKDNNKSKLSQSQKNTLICHSRSKHHDLSPEKIKKLREERGRQAQHQLIKKSLEKTKSQKNKLKKLQILDAKQAEIIKKCRSHKFKPSEAMIEQAFTNIA